MIGEKLQSILQTVSADMITEIFLWGISACFLFAVTALILKKAIRLSLLISNMLISFGILGTFLGVVIGLARFDPNNIDKSIPLLLAGLKTAFITSLVGMGLSIVLRFFSEIIAAIPRKTSEPDIFRSITKALEGYSNELVELRKSIAGDEEGSLASQLKLLRSDFNDQSKESRKYLDINAQLSSEIKKLVADQQDQFHRFTEELWRQLQSFGEMLSKSATEQVINALKDVISDFNKNLTEQFGENFKALDASVQKLVEWQENYRQQLEEIKKQYQTSVEAIQKVQESMEKIGERSESIKDVMERVGDILQVNQHQIENLQQHLESFSEMRDKAIEAVPQIRAKIEEMAEEISESANSMINMQRSIESAMKTIVEGIAENVNTQIQAIDRAMTEEIERVMTEMGEALARISNQFTQDYSRLVQAMHDVIKKAEKA